MTRRTGVFLDESDLRETGTYRIADTNQRPERELVRTLIYEVGRAGSGMFVIVPAKYLTDGYSLLGWFMQLFQPRGAKWWLPAILHDWLYDTAQVTRSQADAILLEAMRTIGVAKWQRLTVYVGVRLGGWMGFGRIDNPANYDLVKQALSASIEDRLAAFLKERRNAPL